MAEAAGDDLQAEQTAGYKPPAPKTLAEITQSDKDDEALEKYKATLLGNIDTNPLFPEIAHNVVVDRLEIDFLGENRPSVTLQLKGADLKQLKDKPIVIKEGVQYKVKIHFFVQREIVSGLKYLQALYKMSVRVAKEDLMVGSYPPKKEAHVFSSPVQDAPSGMLARGSYTVKSRFTDDDKNDFLSWEWVIKIKDKWSD